jgi:4-hydroxy-2-oxoheptanedioate aldolase
VGVIANRLKAQWAEGKPKINGWCGIGNPFTARPAATNGAC